MKTGRKKLKLPEKPELTEIARELGLKQEKNRYYCPLHDQETPDLVIEKDKFICFNGENEGGYKPISLVMHTQDYNKAEALEWLKDHYPNKYKEKSKERVEREEKALEVLNKATELAKNTLNNEKQDLKEQIKEKRNFTEKTIKETEIGYLSEEDVEKLKQEYNRRSLADSGLFNEDKYCLLKNRIVFPYKIGKNTFYMIGRKTEHTESEAKYKKTKKTQENKHILLEYKGEKEHNTIFITEGVTDAISIKQAGYNVVSPVTTSFRSEDVEKIRKKAKNYENIYLAMDGDKAGKEGAEKTAKDLTKAGTNVNIVELPEGMDIDDWTTENGYDLKELKEKSYSYLDKKIQEIKNLEKEKKETETKGQWLSKSTEKTRKIHKLFKLLQDRSDIFLDNLYKEIPMKKPLLEKKMKEIREQEPQKTETTEATEDTEPGAQEDTTLGDVMDNLDHYLNQEKIQSKRLTGHTENTYFQTIWIRDRGRKDPYIITSNKEVKPIKNKLKEKRKELNKDQELSKKQKRTYDYQYAEIDGEEIRFKQKIPQEPHEDINTPNNNVLAYLKGKKELPNKENLYKDIRNTIKTYWDHYREGWYDVATAHSIHSYLTNEIGHTFYLLLHGKHNTGKTSLQKTLAKLQYNGADPGNMTSKLAVRMSHLYQAGINQDEFEKQDKKAMKELTGLYNQGYRKGGSYNIVNLDKGIEMEDQLESIKSFCPKTLSTNTLNPVDYTLVDRSFIVNAVKTGRGVENIDKLDKEEREHFQDLRNQVSAYCLFNWKDIMQDIEDSEDTIEEEARKGDKLSIVKGIVKHFIGIDRAEEVEDHLREEEEIEERGGITERERIILEYIIDKFKEKEEGDKEVKMVTVKPKEIASEVNSSLNIDSDEEYSASSRSVIRKLRKGFNIIREESQKYRGGKEGLTMVDVYRNTLIDSLDREGLYKLEERIHRREEGDRDEDEDEDTPSPKGNAPSTPGSVSSVASVVSENPKKKNLLKTYLELSKEIDRSGVEKKKLKERTDLSEEEYIEKKKELQKEEFLIEVKDKISYNSDKGDLEKALGWKEHQKNIEGEEKEEEDSSENGDFVNDMGSVEEDKHISESSVREECSTLTTLPTFSSLDPEKIKKIEKLVKEFIELSGELDHSRVEKKKLKEFTELEEDEFKEAWNNLTEEEVFKDIRDKYFLDSDKLDKEKIKEVDKDS